MTTQSSDFLDYMSGLLADIDRNVTESEMHPDAIESVSMICEMLEGVIQTQRQMDKIFNMRKVK